MNWTGGSLQRTKKANAGMLQRQKACFAKARTNLQKTPRTTAAPFCPSFLRGNDELGPEGLSSLGSFSVRRGERYMTSGEEALQCEHVPIPENKRSAISGRGVSPRELSSKRAPHHLVHSETPPQAQPGLRRSKRKAPDSDVEMQLLEANKKRLLTQLDWIGVDPLKPVSLLSLACKQNKRIDKHRITTGKRNVVKRQHVDGNSSRGDADLQQLTFSRPFQGCTKREKPENIRIRIGTDALSDGDVPRFEGDAESELCSDLMLFEQDRSLTGQYAGQAGAEPLATCQYHVPMSIDEHDEHDDLLPSISVTDGDVQDYQSVSGSTKWIPAKGDRDKLLKKQSQLSRMATDNLERVKFDYRLVDPAQDDEYSLRFVFSGSSDSSAHVSTHKLGVMDREETGETQPFGKPELTCASQTERVHGVTSDSEGRGAYAIVDQEPWTAYVVISDDSPKTDDTSRQSRQLLQVDETNTRNKSGFPTSWSQCATQGMGHGEGSDTSSHSDPLACLRRGVRQSVAEPVAEIDADCQRKSYAAHVQTVDEEEKKWQAFVLG